MKAYHQKNHYLIHLTECRLTDMNDIDKLYETIDKQRQKLIDWLNRQEPLPPHELSEVCVKLSVLNAMLGEHIPGLKSAQLEAEKAMYDASKALKATDTAATATARLGSLMEREAFSRAEIRHKDLQNLISIAQSHVKALSEEKRSTGL